MDAYAWHTSTPTTVAGSSPPRFLGPCGKSRSDRLGGTCWRGSAILCGRYFIQMEQMMKELTAYLNFDGNCDSAQEAERLFKALGDKGQVTMPLQETFWASRFGMVTDRYGVNWMFNFQGSAIDPFAQK
ncbi:MAG: VOC family protein [Chloroflexi bacterium]|nr:VOC family protein [Chloroflexota bacterium]